MYLFQLVLVALSVLISSAAVPTQTHPTRDIIVSSSPFISTDSSGNFLVNGSRFLFIGTNAYWLPTLNTAEDIDFTLGNMSAAGIKVVRVWGFNDVESIPEDGTWFQLIANGTTTINTGPNGLQKLDTVIELAEKHGIFVLISLTNNWNPRPLLDNITISLGSSSFQMSDEVRDVTPGTNNSLPRNTLSNDYGGMDVYVRQFSNGTNMHDEFYTNPNINKHFTNYVTAIVSRYVDKTSVFSWEIANDPRCNSSLAASPNCTTTTITQFHAVVSAHIRSIDSNHLISSGNQGFFCADCPKLFLSLPLPPPQSSAAPTHMGRRTAKPITKRLSVEPKEIQNRTRKLQRRQEISAPSGGRWMATESKRQEPADEGVGPAFDGSQGVDSEDILAIPGINFSTFQFFPDQFDYGLTDPSLPAFNQTVQSGLNWISKHAEIGVTAGKPVALIAFGLVTQGNAPVFTPFNTSVAPFGPNSASDQPFGVTDQQRDDAYNQWFQAGIQGGLQGILQYQWSQANLTASIGTAIVPAGSGASTQPIVPNTGISPNDGYSLQGVQLGDQQAQRALTPVIVGSVIGGVVALIIILALCYRWWKNTRGPRSIFLTNPSDNEVNAAFMEQHQRGLVTDPSPFILDNTIPVPYYTPDKSSPSPVSSPQSRKHFVYGAQSRAGEDSGIAATTHFPPSTQAGPESRVTMADFNALQARILEIENQALPQRINDVETIARAGSGGTVIDTSLLRPPHASEPPPEYVSPIDARAA